MKASTIKIVNKISSPTEEFENKYGSEAWVCPDDQLWYYRDKKSPSDDISIFASVFLNPFLESIGLRSPPPDPTFGRSTLPFSPHEKVIRDDPQYTCWDTQVYLDQSGRAVEEKTNRWVWYQVWWNEAAAAQTGVKTDLCYSHGLAGYGGEFAQHAKSFLDAGYRVILPDLPSHGKSTGCHCHLTDLNDLAHAIQVVLMDVIKCDAAVGRSQRSAIVGGQSIGGFSSVLYALLGVRPRSYIIQNCSRLYHTPSVPGRLVPSSGPAPKVLGILSLCPLINVSPETTPHFIVENLARGLNLFASRLPLIVAYKGQSSEDRWYEDRYESDPKTYHGKLRVSTALAAFEAVSFINETMGEINIPFKVIHGDADRVTSVNGSKKFFESAKSKDKDLIICPRTEHIVLRVGRDEEDDRKRQVVIGEMLKWMERISQTYS